jgi:hypothetical protein
MCFRQQKKNYAKENYASNKRLIKKRLIYGTKKYKLN